MKEKGVITESLLAMSALQLDIFVPLILHDPDFVTKNRTGNNMYSNALKQYRLFRNVETEEIVDHDEVTSVIEDYANLKETERDAVVKSRIGQGLFRKELIKKYNSSCIITGINEKKLLIASHIKPWAVCSNAERPYPFIDERRLPCRSFMTKPLPKILLPKKEKKLPLLWKP